MEAILRFAAKLLGAALAIFVLFSILDAVGVGAEMIELGRYSLLVATLGGILWTLRKGQD